MLGWLSLSLIVIAISFIVLRVYGSSERRGGSLDARRKEAKKFIDGLDKVLEELSSPLPDRDQLSERWMRRIESDKEDDPTMPDTK
jgi:uncharacterized protein YoxC